MEDTTICGLTVHDALMELRQAIEGGKLVIQSPLTIRALERIRFSADGRIDPQTVDSSVRATARAYIAQKQSRELEALKARTKEERIADLAD